MASACTSSSTGKIALVHFRIALRLDVRSGYDTSNVLTCSCISTVILKWFCGYVKIKAILTGISL